MDDLVEIIDSSVIVRYEGKFVLQIVCISSAASREPDDLSLSEMSSGVIICDLSNEFRKLKVR